MTFDVNFLLFLIHKSENIHLSFSFLYIKPCCNTKEITVDNDALTDTMQNDLQLEDCYAQKSVY